MFESKLSMKFPPSVGPIHFIGIGGIGMSGIAEILCRLGYTVQGSDLGESANLNRLRELGISINVGHRAENLLNACVVVISSAVKKDNPELLAARQMRLPVIRRAEMLAELMKLKPSIAVSGTHGKTTTTSLVACLLEEAKLDPTVINGGIINAYGTNGRLGQGEWVVVEADESDGSFNKLFPTLAIVTNIDPEHMDFYGDFDTLKKAFFDFIEKIPFYGLGVLCIDHPVVRELSTQVTDRPIMTYGLSTDAHVQAHNIRLEKEGTRFDLTTPRGTYKDLFVTLFGEHNVLNTLAAICIAFKLGLEETCIKQALANFKGVKRRFTKTGEVNKITFIDDYAHHPVEISVVLKTAKNVSPGRLIAVLQPHRYSRLRDLFSDFGSALEAADIVIMAPVYSAGEAEILNINSEKLAESLKQEVHLIHSQAELAPLLAKLAQPNDYVVCLGAGSISQWANELPDQIKTILHKTGKAA